MRVACVCSMWKKSRRNNELKKEIKKSAHTHHIWPRNEMRLPYFISIPEKFFFFESHAFFLTVFFSLNRHNSIDNSLSAVWNHQVKQEEWEYLGDARVRPRKNCFFFVLFLRKHGKTKTMTKIKSEQILFRFLFSHNCKLNLNEYANGRWK